MSTSVDLLEKSSVVDVNLRQNKQDRYTTCFKTCGTNPWFFPKGFNAKNGAKQSFRDGVGGGGVKGCGGGGGIKIV